MRDKGLGGVLIVCVLFLGAIFGGVAEPTAGGVFLHGGSAGWYPPELSQETWETV